MKPTLKRYLPILTFLLSGLFCSAQLIDQEQVKLRAAGRVEQLADYIEIMTDKNIPKVDRMDIRLNALNLFVGAGEPYEENGVLRKNGAIMEVTSRWRKTPNPRPVKDYFIGIINFRSYNHVTIGGADISQIKVSNLRKRPDGRYSCVCTFDQEFTGYSKEGRVLLRDIDRKSVTCIIEIDETEWGIEYIIKLGDVRVVQSAEDEI